MDKRAGDKKGWFYFALGSTAVSILSFFLPVISMYDGSYNHKFNIIDLISGSSEFREYVIERYRGPLVMEIRSESVSILAVIAAASIICAVVGIITLRVQRPNTKNFVLTLAGLAGILIPSVVLIICVYGYGSYYDGVMQIGIAPIISPIAVIASIITVIRRKDKVAKELEQEAKEKGLIWEAGDL